MFGLDAGLSFAGGLITNAFNASNRDKAAKEAKEAAREQMAFQERMSNTAYQRSMQDMRTAGLNPILAYQKGPASSPTGALAATPPPTTFTDPVSPAVSTAMQSRRLTEEVKNMQEQNKNLQATNNLIRAQTIREGSQVGQINASTAIMAEQLKSAVREGAKGQIDEAFYKTPAGKIMRTIGTTAEELGRIVPRISIRTGSQRSYHSGDVNNFKGD